MFALHKGLLFVSHRQGRRSDAALFPHLVIAVSLVRNPRHADPAEKHIRGNFLINRDLSRITALTRNDDRISARLRVRPRPSPRISQGIVPVRRKSLPIPINKRRRLDGSAAVSHNDIVRRNIVISQGFRHDVKINILRPRVISLSPHGNDGTRFALCVHVNIISICQGIIPAFYKFHRLRIIFPHQVSLRGNRAVVNMNLRLDRAARISLVAHGNHIEPLICTDTLIMGINMGLHRIDRLVRRKHAALSFGFRVPAPENLTGKLLFLRHLRLAHAVPIA